MRYRKLTADGDYSIGPQVTWLVDTPEGVAQAVKTRLRLLAGEWFLDIEEGLRLRLILGNNTQGTRDAEIKRRILGTQGVQSITSYASQIDNRAFSVSAVLATIYGAVQFNTTEAF